MNNVQEKCSHTRTSLFLQPMQLPAGTICLGTGPAQQSHLTLLLLTLAPYEVLVAVIRGREMSPFGTCTRSLHRGQLNCTRKSLLSWPSGRFLTWLSRHWVQSEFRQVMVRVYHHARLGSGLYIGWTHSPVSKYRIPGGKGSVLAGIADPQFTLDFRWLARTRLRWVAILC